MVYCVTRGTLKAEAASKADRPCGLMRIKSLNPNWNQAGLGFHRCVMKQGLAAALSGLLLGCTDAARAPPPEAAPPPPPVALDVYRGSAVAQQVCVQCHDIGIKGVLPSTRVNAPGFPEVANRGGMTAEQLKQWMRTTHPIMPTFMFNDNAVGDLAAYIMSLRRPD